MPCKPLSQSSVSPPNIPDVSGFAIPLPSTGIPFPSVDLPDLGNLYNLLSFVLPAGILKPNFNPDYLDNIYGAVNDLLGKFAPFLMLYKFFLPVLNLILCIIEVLCSLVDPFKTPQALIRLFRQCIPDFLSLFPFFALIIMIISLLLLILSLIEYLLTRIIQIIEIIIQDIIALGRAAQRLESDSILAIITKIGNLLCFLQNLFVILGVILLIIQIIQAMIALTFNIPPCDSSNGSSSGCCTPDVCPDFIKNNDTITSSTGNFQYYREVGIDSGLSLPIGFPPIVSVIRQESWQFYDPNLAKNKAFINITQAYDLPAGTTKVFFPSGTNYTTSTTSKSVPYTISFRFFYDPVNFNISDPKGPRFVRAENVIIQNPPNAGVSSFDNSIVAPFNGTLNLIGGVMTEDNGTPILNLFGQKIPINTFIHQQVSNIRQPIGNFNGLVNDGYLFSDLTYTFSINHNILWSEALITLGCIPEVGINRDSINATIGAQFNKNGAELAKIVLPDITTTQSCITDAITRFTKNITTESANIFQTDITNCLNALKSQTGSALSSAISAGFDQYKSTFSIDPSIQFTTQAIKVSVSLNESSGQSMTTNLPAVVADQLAQKLSGVATFGTLGQFTYDGYSKFVADITSDKSGNGTIKVAFNFNFISVLSNPSDTSQPVTVSITELPYTFVESPFASSSGQPRRDSGDIAREGS